MALSVVGAVFLLLVSAVIPRIFAFNLEPRIPIIKQGPEGSYFGYSVAAHIIEDRGSIDNSRILVGAPKLNNIGTLYQCNLNPRRSGDCTILDVQEDPPADDEIRKDQWLGVAVKSQKPGGYAMVCAHRHVKSQRNARWGFGVCYSLTNYLDQDRVWEPCVGRSVSKAHEEFGYCQTGTSGAITEDDTILFGSPGPFTWKGTVFSNNVRFGLKDDKQWYHGPLEDNSPVEKYSYLGMSVTYGKFFDNSYSYVTGAPRSNGTGQVVFFKKTKNPTYNVELILSGDTFASSFGYEVAALDINNDGAIDLVVGAPFFYGKDAGGAIYVYMNSNPRGNLSKVPQRIHGKAESRFGLSLASLKDINKDGYEDLAVGAPYDGDGAVYIFLGSEKGLKKEPSQEIRPSQFFGPSFKTFGYSLSGGVDLDKNGYPDLLVGAYEADRVVLLRSRPVIDMNTKVEGDLENIDPTLPGCDGDSDSAQVCFRIRACFSFSTNKKPLASKLDIKYRIEAETFTGIPISRVIFKASNEENRKNVVTRNFTVYRSEYNQERCQDEIAYLKDNHGDILTPMKFQLTYSLIQAVPFQDEFGPLYDINQLPILNQEEAKRIFQVTFAKDCENDICESDLHVDAKLNTVGDTFALGEVNELVLNVSISNRGESAYESYAYITYPESLSYIASHAENAQSCERPNATLLTCYIANPLKKNIVAFYSIRFSPSGVKNDETKLEFKVKVNSTSQEISPEPDTALTAVVVRKAEIGIHGGTPDDQVFYGGDVRGESAMKTEDEIGSHTEHNYHVRNSGPWKIETFDVVVQWPFEAENKEKHGKWLLYLVENPVVEIDKSVVSRCNMSPEQVNPLNLATTTSSPQSKRTESSSPTQNVNDKDETNRRRKREVVVLPSNEEVDGRMQKVVKMDCNLGTARCFTFRCAIPNLDAGKDAVVRIRSRLWNSTFVEDYPDVDMVLIRSYGQIEIDPKYGVQQNTSNDRAFAETKAFHQYEISKKKQDIDIWIIVGAVIGGLILLLIIVLILWKLGFFRRKKHEEMLSGNLEKNKENNDYIH